MMRKLKTFHLFIYCILLISGIPRVFGMNSLSVTDSLSHVLLQAPDTSKPGILLKLSHELKNTSPQIAFDYAHNALEIAINVNDTNHIADSYMAIAEFYTDRAMYDKALYYLTSALKLFENSGNKQRVAAFANKIGFVYLQSGNYKLARANFIKAIGLNKETRNFYEITRNYMNMGTLSLKTDSIEKGLSYYLVAIMIADSLHMEKEKIELSNNIGSGYLKLGYCNKALENYYHSLELLAKNPDNLVRTNTVIHIGTGYYCLKNYPAAMKYANMGYQLAKTGHFNQEYSDACKLLSDIYAAQRDFESAYTYFETYKHISDTLMSIEKAGEVAKIQMLYGFEKIEHENEALRIENQLSKQTIHTRSIVIAIIASLLLLTAVLLYVLVRLNLKYKKLNHKLKDQGRELEALNDQKDKFFSFVAHNLKNPFNTIMGFAELMRRQNETNRAEKSRQYSELIYNLSSHVQRVLSSLLEWSRLQRKNFEYKPELIELNSIIKDVLEMSSREASRKSVSLKFNETGLVYANADRTMITMVLENLISNALEFTESTGKITIHCRTGSNFAEVSVSDTGVGIAPEAISGLFQFELSRPHIGSGNSKGSGLGLILCKEMITKNKGEISVKSELGKGSTFTFKLPGYTPNNYSISATNEILEKYGSHTGDLLDKIPDPALEEIRKTLVPQYNELIKVLSFEKLEVFIQSILNTGKKYDIKNLADYGHTLENLAKAHQIDQIMKVLPAFKKYLSHIEI